MNQPSVPIKTAIAQRQKSRCLDDSQVAHLLQLQAVHANVVPTQPRRLLRLQFGLIASLGVIGGLLLALWFGLHTPALQSPDYLERIADEVAMNHLKLKPLEVKSNNLETLTDYFTELDFQPVQIALLNDAEAPLLGARYCSIQGKTAAQFRVQQRGGKLQTVYEARYDPAVHGPLPDIAQGAAPVERTARGVPVTVWTDRGLLFAVTGG